MALATSCHHPKSLFLCPDCKCFNHVLITFISFSGAEDFREVMYKQIAMGLNDVKHYKDRRKGIIVSLCEYNGSELVN